MEAMKSFRKKMVILAVLAFGLVAVSFGVENEITDVSPNTAEQGTTGLLVTIMLDTDEPPAPPANIQPQNVMIGTISGSSVSHVSQYVVTAVFDIPAGQTPGAKDVSVTFPLPNTDTLVFSMAGGFTVTDGADTPPSIMQQPQSKTVGPGSLVSFTVLASGSTPLEYQWQKDLIDIADANSPVYSIVAVQESDEGDYRCVVSNAFGADISDMAVLTVDEDVYCGTYPIVDTGQVTCYDNSDEITPPGLGQDFYGQDAQIDGYQPSYTVSGDGLTVTDNITGLMWARSPDWDDDGDVDADDKMTVTEAMAYPATLNGQSYAGYNNWRLPSIKELYSLMNFAGRDPSGYSGTDTSGLIPFIDTNAFEFGYGDTSADERIIDAQWASSTLYVSTTMGGNETMFGLNLADGRIKGYPTANKEYYVYFVRGNTDYGINNFMNNNDGTISDKATGLMWSRDDSGSGLNWQEALAWVQTKNAESYLGYNDWQLPNAKQLQSIIDYTRSPDTTGSAAIDPMFNATAITNEAGLVDYACYWSGTTHANYQENNTGASGAYVAFGRAMGYWQSQWQDVHGAGCQRSDPKEGDPADWPTGHGPQGDAIRIYNYIRLVRDTQCGEPGFVSTLNGDQNDDCYVNMKDVAVLSDGWLSDYGISELITVAENWLNCNAPACSQ